MISDHHTLNYLYIYFYTQFLRATLRRQSKIIEILISNRANVNLVSRDQRAPLNMAVNNQDEISAALLLKAGAEVDHPNENGLAPLHVAAKSGRNNFFFVSY